jgi:catechol 2,3-dioxygenase-like lactoylglutathione lyase family enzyme
MFLGLRTVIYPAPDLDAAKRFYTGLLGFEPYFDEPFYVGFAVAGYELALDPNGAVEDGPVTYWGVRDADEGLAWLTSHGATERSAVQEVGGGIRVAAAADPFGSIIGLIENPHFEAADVSGQTGAGR